MTKVTFQREGNALYRANENSINQKKIDGKEIKTFKRPELNMVDRVSSLQRERENKRRNRICDTIGFDGSF
jgi:hypothetical protein